MKSFYRQIPFDGAPTRNVHRYLNRTRYEEEQNLSLLINFCHVLVRYIVNHIDCIFGFGTSFILQKQNDNR